MSEEGWHGFLAAEGVDDWVVLHGGATAVFRVGSLSEAARLAEAVAKAPGIAGAGVLLTLADTRVTVRLSRDIWNLEPRHVQLARAVSAVARKHGAVPDRAAVQEVQVAIAAKRDAIDVGFCVPSSATPRWPTTMRSTPLDTDRRSGCRSSTRPSHCATRCTSTCLSRVSASRRVSRRRSLRAAVSSTSRMHHRTGRSPTARATAFVSVRGQMGPPGDC